MCVNICLRSMQIMLLQKTFLLIYVYDVSVKWHDSECRVILILT